MNTQNLKTVSALQMISVASQLCLGNGVALIKVTKHKVVIMKTILSNVVTTILSGFNFLCIFSYLINAPEKFSFVFSMIFTLQHAYERNATNRSNKMHVRNSNCF